MRSQKRSLLTAVSLGSLCAAHAQAATINLSESETIFSPPTLRDRPIAQIQIAGAVDERSSADYVDNYADDIGDTVFFAPGVTVNGLDIQEPRVTIRGFAIGNNQHRSTVKYLRDGAPLTDVHGRTDTTILDPQTIKTLGIERGVASLRDGGDNLGGVVKLTSRTGRTSPNGLTVRVDGGSTINARPEAQANVSIAGANGSFDYYAGLTGIYENAWRDNNRRTGEIFHANIGFAPLERLTTRFSVDLANTQTELAGGLTLTDLEADAQNPTPPVTLGPLFPGGPIFNLVDGARQDDFARDLRDGRVANTTNFSILGHDIELGGHYRRGTVDSPQIDFVGFIEEESDEWGARASVKREARLLGRDGGYEIGAERIQGTTTSDRFENVNGTRGDELSSAEYQSRNFTGFVSAFLKPLERLTVDLGAKYISVRREATDLSNDDLDSQTFTGVAARGGVRFDVSEALQVFVSAERSYETPTIDELTLGNPGSLNGLDEQDSFGLQGGVRGRVNQWIAWDVTYFETDLEGEIINIADPSSFVNGDIFVNVDDTSHKGVEAAVDLSLIGAGAQTGQTALTLRNVYHYNNARFVDAGPLGGIDGNRIAGIPSHAYRGEIRYESVGSWFVAANVRLTGGDYFADHENTTSIPSQAIVGVSAGYRLADNIEVFASGENLTDQAYTAGISPVLTLSPADDRIFTPGQRVSVYGGMRYRF